MKRNTATGSVSVKREVERFGTSETAKKGATLPGYRRRDALTALLNHASFQNEVKERFAKAKSEKKPLACLLIDIDYFRSINNRFGFSFGDEIVMQIAEILHGKAPQDTIIARFGGEEFALAWMPNSQNAAIAVAEKIREAVADHKFVSVTQSTYLTISAGLAVGDEKTRSAAELLASCELVLRTAKREGRNRVCYWQREAEHHNDQPQDEIITELQRKFADLEREMKAFSTSEVRSLIENLAIPDGLSEDHSENVAFIAASIADELGMDEREIDTIISAALLHDIGKLGIDGNILSKDGALSPEEFEEIKKHPLLGAEFLHEARFFEQELPMILHHHERFDGQGYPDGLRGEEIPLGARIISVAETIDGLLSGSTYREASSSRETITELRRCSGTQFDPQLVQIAIRLIETGRIG